MFCDYEQFEKEASALIKNWSKYSPERKKILYLVMREIARRIELEEKKGDEEKSG